ncbi:MAG: MFS transporter [Candidatus Eremiobacterota bacterium]
MLGMNRYQWLVLFAAWLGWGFDIFDALLFNLVAPNCVPTLLGMRIDDPGARGAYLEWTAYMSALLLIGWAIGGIFFGKVADHLGRTRTLMLTMLLYSLGTAACAFAPNIWVLALFRFVSSLGIGGEWAAGASLVAEVVPDKRRVEAGAILYTSAPMGLFLASFVNEQIAGEWFAAHPETSWRYVFLCGLVPAAAAMAVRWFIHEPETWKQARAETRPPAIGELFGPEVRRLTFSGFAMAFTALICWWTCSSFIPAISTGLAEDHLASLGSETRKEDVAEIQAVKEDWKAYGTNIFNVGGLLGTLLTVFFAKTLGRRPTFAIYFLGASLSLFSAFGLDLPPERRIDTFFLLGLTVFGVFGMFTYYLPELFPTRLRATGSGFCYNVGRILTAAGPFLVGAVVRSQGHVGAMNVMKWVAVVPLIALMLLPWVIETKDRGLDGGRQC